MKTTPLVSLAAFAVILASGCDRKSSEAAQKIAELERKANDAAQKQQELEQELQERKLAAERDEIERERAKIEQDRLDLEQSQSDAASAEAEKLRQREQDLATREGKLEMQQSTLDEKQSDLQQKDHQLSAKDREIAGREALFKEERNPQPQSAPVGDYGTFYESLSPYGSWIEIPVYGYVWQPVIVRDASWRPYCHGRWVCTDHGWTWISDEPFGWAVYHYGRWTQLRDRGWIWVPGCEWAPSWVSWRSCGTHIGWAPLPPETLAFRGRHWDSRVDVACGIGAAWFNFVEIAHFGGGAYLHCLPVAQNNVIFQQTVNITNIYTRNNRVFCGGPSYGDVCRQASHPPPYCRLQLDGSHAPAGRRPRFQGDLLTVAAPNIDAPWNEGLKPGKITGRIESVQVNRDKEPEAELTEGFIKHREESRQQADLVIADLGGAGKFNQHRMEQLESNRRQTRDSTPRVTSNRVTGSRPAAPDLTGKPAERTQPGRQPQQPRPDQERASHDDRPPAGMNHGKPDVVRNNPEPVPQPDAQNERIRRQQQAQAEQERQNQETRRPEEQIRRDNDNIRVLPKVPPHVDPNAERQRTQQEQQAERARQFQEQQQEAQRQREQARQQQFEAEQRENERQQAEVQAQRAARQQQDTQRQREQSRPQQEVQRPRDQPRQQQPQSQPRQQQPQQQPSQRSQGSQRQKQPGDDPRQN